jgi:dTDP-4-dehydrorhamnose reductase
MISYDPNQRKTTNIVQSLHDIAELTHRRSLIIVFSDLLDDPDKVDELFRALEHMRHNKHEVILFHVVDGKKEIDFELGNRPFNLVDMETGERMKIRPAEVKESYKKAVNTYFEELKMRSINNRIDFMPADIHEGYNQILLQYFLKRQKMY